MKTLDLCNVGLAERNTLVARRYAKLASGETFEIVTDAPPWVLYHQLQTEHLDKFEWTMLERGPDRFVVRVTRKS